jgi:hypothetical protein
VCLVVQGLNHAFMNASALASSGYNIVAVLEDSDLVVRLCLGLNQSDALAGLRLFGQPGIY